MLADSLFNLYSILPDEEKELFWKLVKSDRPMTHNNLRIISEYKLIPESLYNRLLNKIDWHDITEPTISQVAEYLEVSTDKIKADLYKKDCPLKVTYKGGCGRRNQKRFLKASLYANCMQIKNGYFL